jgi:hypothetical protein
MNDDSVTREQVGLLERDDAHRRRQKVVRFLEEVYGAVSVEVWPGVTPDISEQPDLKKLVELISVVDGGNQELTDALLITMPDLPPTTDENAPYHGKQYLIWAEENLSI